MPGYFWGAVNVASSYTDNYVQTPGVGLITGRAMFNGAVGVISTALTAYCSGKGAARSVVLSLGSIATGAFGVGAAGSAQSTGWVNASQIYFAGGSATFTIDMNGSAYFGRANGGGSTDSYGTGYGVLYGGIYYVQAPTAPPTAPSLAAIGATGIQVDWSAPADNGESPITGYAIQRASTASFADAVTTTVGNVLTTNLTGLTPGSTSYIRVMARNAVTTAAGTYGLASSWSSLKLASGAYVGDGTTWPVGQLTVGDGTAWNTPQVLIGDGTNWNPAL